jgi:hypothetical protein
MNRLSFCSGDFVRWFDGALEHRGVLQHIARTHAMILSTEGRLIAVPVKDLSLAIHEASGVFDLTRL